MRLSALSLSALLAGLVGGLHCAAMCGGLRPRRRRATRACCGRGARSCVRQLTYHVGRIGSYALLGAAVRRGGRLGARRREARARATAPLCRGERASAPRGRHRHATHSRHHVARTCRRDRLHARAAARAAARSSATAAGSRLALGALWGFVPCTLVYGVLPLALFSGGAWQGALVMLVFGAGTLPHLVGAGLALSRIDLRGPRVRRAAAIVIGAVCAGRALPRGLRARDPRARTVLPVLVGGDRRRSAAVQASRCGRRASRTRPSSAWD